MRTFGLLGKNIDYSFSRTYFNEKFEKEEIAAVYKNFDIQNIEKLPELLKRNDISGLNVTIPYKQEVIKFLDHLDTHAREINAVNVVKFKDGKLIGFNTDFIGFTEAIKPHLKKYHQKALILGTGGASKAVAYGLKLLKIKSTFVSRNPESDQISYEQLDKNLMLEHQLIINTTPLGTFPEIQLHPNIPFDLITQNHLIFDLIYNPEKTALLKNAENRNATILNGLKMLEIQADEAWKIWNQ
ncbi:shikimate dehydrogenase [Gramella sp. AN32]|uniref:Shikimate dehydrogenase family protein n=1 Tax=Christiangramia antarctica TaxID=2058158 RepID=A0ABW5X790_9FLAO|nr:shikimate dehydrogenase [Gramella sp. AN32]MCM4154470.1 shikimate dehydrogenase [Gramella sp. AN32]